MLEGVKLEGSQLEGVTLEVDALEGGVLEGVVIKGVAREVFRQAVRWEGLTHAGVALPPFITWLRATSDTTTPVRALVTKALSTMCILPMTFEHIIIRRKSWSIKSRSFGSNGRRLMRMIFDFANFTPYHKLRYLHAMTRKSKLR